MIDSLSGGPDGSPQQPGAMTLAGTPAASPGAMDARDVTPQAPSADRPGPGRAGEAKRHPSKDSTESKDSAAKPAKPKATQPAKVRAVGGLTQAQMDNAAVIVKVAKRSKLSRRAQVIAVATAMQESTLRNLANPSHPQSMRMPNQGTGFDFDSLGLFQQRPASGWGSPRQLMDPVYASNAFYEALLDVDGWQHMPVTVAAQTVQGSAFPDAYAKHEHLATSVVEALND